MNANKIGPLRIVSSLHPSLTVGIVDTEWKEKRMLSWKEQVWIVRQPLDFPDNKSIERASPSLHSFDV
jgi:hypothetical protein